MQRLRYTLLPENDVAQLGLIVLQSDVTIEDEFRYYFSEMPVSLLVNRIPFVNEVTVETLQEMEGHVGRTVSLFPTTSRFHSIGYACTSGALHIGTERIQALVQAQRECAQVCNPMQAAINALRQINARHIAYLGPYSQHVCQTMIDRFEQEGITVALAATYDEDQDVKVGRISPQSIREDAVAMVATRTTPIDAVFVACTNMKCARIIPQIEAATGVTALSSNLVLAWDMARAAGVPLRDASKGRLCQ